MGQTPRPVDAGVSLGQVFLGKYRVDEILGHGGMGVVAKCMHLALNERVAIKMLRRDVLTDRDAVERFAREARAAAKLRSEYVARVLDVGELENRAPYMVMEFLDGHDLGELIDERGCLPAPWATELMLQACEALAEAHSIGIVHRDIKPTNLFVTWRPDGSALIKVLDFGISKAPAGTDMELTQTQSLLGTPAYMSPEQLRSARTVDARSDIWSLGTVMYELLEGRRPFEADSFSEMCVKVSIEPPEPMRNVPPPLQQVVMRCLAKSPEQRYASMADLGRDLVPFSQDPASAAILVERMVRMLGRRSSLDWTDASAVAYTASVPQPLAYREGSTPVSPPSEMTLKRPPGRRRAAFVVGAAAVVAIGVAIGVAVDRASNDGRGRAELAPRPAPMPPPAQPPAPPPAPAPAPAPAPERFADESKREETRAPDEKKRAPVVKRAAAQKPHTVAHPPPPEPPKLEVAPPAPPCKVYEHPHGCPRP